MKNTATLPKISNNVLVIDTASPALAVGINGMVDCWTSPDHHTDTLLVRIDKLLKRAKVTPEKLKGVVFVAGPGSFTGLRIGATVANGIGFVEHIGVVGISEFERIAKLIIKVDWILLDAGRGEIFVRHASEAPTLLPIDKLKSRIKKGDRVYVATPDLVAKLHSQIVGAGTIVIGPVPQPDKLRVMMQAKVPNNYRQALPLYLREANITMPSKKSKARPKTA